MSIQTTYKITIKNPELQAVIRKALKDKEELFSYDKASLEEFKKRISKKR